MQRGMVMSLGITWYTLEEAAAKYSLEKAIIERWVAQGVVRAERDKFFVLWVNNDDLGLRVQEGPLTDNYPNLGFRE